jgi:hypothetical protein
MQVMIDAMRPGGWLVLEDADPSLQPLACPDERGPPKSWPIDCAPGSAH